jgi:predicted dehydrogenase
VHDLEGLRAERFAAKHASATVAGSVDEVIAGSDAVYVCTWTAAHPEAVYAVVEAEKPVFCEKPLAVDLATVEAMTAAVQEAGVVNQVGLVLRHSPAFRWLEQRVGDGEAGSLMSIVFRDDQYLPVQGLYQSSWRADVSKAGAGALLEHSIHDLDLLRWLMGPIASVSARLGTVHGLDGIEDQVSVLLVAESGAHASLVSVWHDVLSRPSQRRVEVFCRNTVLTVSGDWSGPVSAESSDGPTKPLEGHELVAEATAADGMGTNPDADFVAAIRNGGQAYPDFGLAAEAHRLADAAYRSAAEAGRTISL